MLKIEHLSIIYGDRIILDDTAIQFPRGSVSVVQGPSGAGKSSLLNVLGLMQRPNKECVYTNDGVDISHYTEKEKADFRLHNMGFVFQQNNLIQTLSAHENVSIPLMVLSTDENVKDKVNEILDYVGVRHLANNYPSSLSGGEEQRVAVARAIANDADIILADEPTASLDETNVNVILELLQKLAHELNKVVVIVSHDAKVLRIADYVYKIENQSIVEVLSKKATKVKKQMTDKTKSDGFGKRKMVDFVRFYTKRRIGDRLLNKTFIAVTAFITAIVIIFVNFGSEYAQGQKDFINAISDRSIFVMNDTLSLRSKKYYPSASPISKRELLMIEQIPHILQTYPYYEFLSATSFANGNDQAEITIKDERNMVVPKRHVQEIETDGMSDNFAVTPLYPEENINFLLEHKSDNSTEKGVIITNVLAKTFDIELESLIDKEIELKTFVPISLYDEKIMDEDGLQTIGEQTVMNEKNNMFYKLVSIKSKIKGILKPTYNLQRSQHKALILLDYDVFNEVLETNKDISYGNIATNVQQKALTPNAFVMFVNSYENVPTVVQKLRTISPIFEIANEASDIQQIQGNIELAKNVTLVITILFIGIIILMFGMVYYIKNRSRKKEVGILKALGLTRNNIVHIITFEMWLIAIQAFIVGVLMSFGFAYLGNAFVRLPVFTITGLSIFVGLVVSVGIVILAGVLPIYNASKVDPIQAMYEINK